MNIAKYYYPTCELFWPMYYIKVQWYATTVTALYIDLNVIVITFGLLSLCCEHCLVNMFSYYNDSY